eukprot:1159202-Pelagomonas_calceolata.AAC.6
MGLWCNAQGSVMQCPGDCGAMPWEQSNWRALCHGGHDGGLTTCSTTQSAGWCEHRGANGRQGDKGMQAN